MTALATYVGVRAIKYETGTKVIERLLGQGIARREQADNGYRKQKQAKKTRDWVQPKWDLQSSVFHCSDLTS